MADSEKGQARKITPEIQRYLTMWERDPKSRVFAPLAEEYRKVGDLERAIEVCKKGLEVHPNYVSGRVALGRAYFDMGDLRGARAQLEMVYEADPENLVAAKTLGEIYEAEGDLEKALLCYRLAHYSTPSATEITDKIKSIQQLMSSNAREMAAGGKNAKAAAAASQAVAPVEKAEPDDEDAGEMVEEHLSPLEAARKALRQAEREAAGESDEEESRETESDLKQEIERLRRVPERLLYERDELEVATDEFFLGAEELAKRREEKKIAEVKKEFAAQSLTELLLRQGYTQRAVKVYEEFSVSDPANEQAARRIKELKEQLKVVEKEIEARQSETQTPPSKHAASPEVAGSIQNWLRRVLEGA